MKKITPISPAALRPACDPAQFQFDSTDQIIDLLENIGQARALEALSFGIQMRQRGYHMFAVGPSGFGKNYFIRHYLRNVTSKEFSPDDWCYVYNFHLPQKPIALQFPPGIGEIFKQQMKELVDHLHYAIPYLFNSREYRSRIEKIELKYKSMEDRYFSKIQKEAKKNALGIVETLGNYEVVPLVNDEQMTDAQLNGLNESEIKELKNKINKIKARLDKIKEDMPVWYKQKHEQLKEIRNDFCNTLVSSLIGPIKEQYTDLKVLSYLRDVQKDIIEFPDNFMHKDIADNEHGIEGPYKNEALLRYEVNVIVSNHKEKHAPIVFERHPNYINLIGQLEGTAQHGTPISDHTLIKPGALHKANGGYLMLEIKKLLNDIHAWNSLKRILLEQKIAIEPLQSQSGSNSTQLQPEPIPLKTKVILLGDRYLYDELGQDDDDFNKLFQVLVDFETTIERNDEHLQQFICYIARIIKKRKLLPFHRNAVAAIIDNCIRASGNSRKIALQRSSIVEMLEESSYWAGQRSQSTVMKEDVEKAESARMYRIDKVRKEYYQDILSEDILIDLKNEVVGQINAITVIHLPNFSFGLPTRITASTRAGKQAMIDIQREVNLGGANHSKGVLILSGYLKGKYISTLPFFLSASLVLEQTYGIVDGDSASLAELCALISSITRIPIKQSFAVTGSINQHGIVQAIGNVNEKVEGFFDICKLQGLTGKQGVLIPPSNLKNLMLKQEVVDACEQGRFHLYAVPCVDVALSILTGKNSKEIHKMCEVNLTQFAKIGNELLPPEC